MPDLLAATGDSEIFFENDDGRIVLILPYLGRVMIGTTDIRIDNPDDAVISDEEINYILGMVDKVFPAIQVDRSHIVFSFSAVRPLPYSEVSATGQISRDHSIETIPADDAARYPIYSLVGGKWTTFRAFAEETTDRVLSDLDLPTANEHHKHCYRRRTRLSPQRQGEGDLAARLAAAQRTALGPPA